MTIVMLDENCIPVRVQIDVEARRRELEAERLAGLHKPARRRAEHASLILSH